MLRTLGCVTALVAVVLVASAFGSSGGVFASGGLGGVAAGQQRHFDATRGPQIAGEFESSRPLGSLKPAQVDANTQSYEDKTGDSSGAPDVDGIRISNDDAGLITFRISFANRTTLQGQDLVLIAFDVDVLSEVNGATGDAGADFVLSANETGWLLNKWNGSGYDSISPSSASARLGGGVLTFQVNRSDLQSRSPELGFDVVTSADAGNTFPEEAPDSFLPGGWSVYEIRITGATPKLVRDFLSVGEAKAGTTFSVQLSYARTDSDDPTTPDLTGKKISCKASVSGRRLRATEQQSGGSLVNCSWKLPKASRGKTVKGSVSVSFSSQSWAHLTVPFQKKIR